MPTYTATKTDYSGTYTIEAEFKITSSGYPSNNWDDPGAPPEIEMESVSMWMNSAPDGVQVFEGKNIPTDIYEALEAEIIEKFDFDDYYEETP